MPKRDPEHMKAQKERILRATIRSISKKGPERTSIPDICKEAGLSTGALYVHFPNKGAIIAEAMRYGSTLERQLPETWEEILALLSSTTGQLGFDLVTIIRFRLHMQAEAAMPGDLHKAMAPLLNYSLDVFAQRLQELANRGEIKLLFPAHETAINIVALVEGRLWLAATTDQGSANLSDSLKRAISLFVAE